MRYLKIGLVTAWVLWTFGLVTGCGSAGYESLNDADAAAASMDSAAALTPENPPPPETAQVASTVTLEAALNSLEGISAPAGVEVELFDELQAELARVLTSLYGDSPEAIGVTARTASAVDTSAWGLQGLMLPTGTVTLAWHGQHTGDYNLDGLVGVSDLTPLGIHYNAVTQLDEEGLPVVAGDNEWIVAVDGNNDGLVNLSDITQIGQNYNSLHHGYRVYTGIAIAGAEVVWDEAFLAAVDPHNTDVTVPFNGSKEASQVNCYTFTFPKPTLTATEVLHVRVVSYNGVVESQPTEAHLIDGPHAPMYCDTCHQLTTMDFRGVDDTCLTCHPTPPEDDTKTWGDTPITHNSCFGCHDAHGYSPDPPQDACSKCHSATEADVAEAGMPDCLGCHLFPHVPQLSPEPQDCEVCHAGVTTQLGDGGMQDCAICHEDHSFTIDYTTESCMVCHPTPPAVTGGTWAQSPGAHNSCELCHGQHQFRPEQPDTICITCHADVPGSGHGMGSGNCLGCHGNPHVPLTEMDPASCQSCHPNPPEDVTKEWADAPGLHSVCQQCHPGPGHGEKPDPAEGICVTCHADQVTAGHAGGSTACLVCHSFPHIPDFSITQDACLICHPTPPEDGTAAWEDAPGSHDQCLSCHGDTGHGDKPAPPETICADCHSTLITDGHAAGYAQCLDCHLQVHLPEKETSHEIHTAQGCATCHNPTPSDMPLRATCTVCHGGKVNHQLGIECLECHGN